MSGKTISVELSARELSAVNAALELLESDLEGETEDSAKARKLLLLTRQTRAVVHEAMTPEAFEINWDYWA
ncbi:MAG: hypothetical protein LBQ92_02120 [Propionibacteriaceae bacterium]|jgi:hypothetical protein|nr:hypothetical protein [Propionibacteriaceae bacterium]